MAPGLHDLLFLHLRRRAIVVLQRLRSQPFQSLQAIFFSGVDNTTDIKNIPLVSVVVPCYNHAKFLEQRLQSIAEQTYTNFEVILLDDASNDNSLPLLQQFQQQHPQFTRLLANEANSGSPFSQWRKGIQAAQGDLIWIAESDDFCAEDFLEKLVPVFRNQGVMLAFGSTQFVSEDGKQTVWSLAEYLPELGAKIWTQSFVESAHQLVWRVWNYKNLVVNASGALFRRVEGLPVLEDPILLGLRMCGDWYFYLHLIRAGLVAYNPEAINHYRQHPSNTSVSLHGSEQDLQEHLVLAETVLKLYKLSQGHPALLQKALLQRWQRHRNEAIPTALSHRIDELTSPSPSHQGRLANVMIATYALIPGGGEILPIRLANSLHQAGYAVTMLNCRQYPSDPGIRSMLRPGIPLIELDSLESLSLLIQNLGIEILHTHHAWVDVSFCELLQGVCDVRHVLTSHGMYDSLGPERLKELRPMLGPWVSQATYVADNNRSALLELGISEDRLTKVANAIDDTPIRPVSREHLGLTDNAFVVCLVSRAIREKGWEEAIEAVRLARANTSRDLQLLIIGDGIERHRLREQASLEWVHFLGLQPNSRDFFATADLGILPSFFTGESQPLTLIECLAAGTPYLASDIGEIASMLSTTEGSAGMTIPLSQGKVCCQAFAAAILSYVNDPQKLEHHRSLARLAATKFSVQAMLKAYTRVYDAALAQSPSASETPISRT
ncbi:glycosyltransferase [Synechococcus sp. BSF8S]|uniref:glycosyltransferase n=1 Tax=Synechococcales TaxID=1890424 RepID=UPI00162A3E74|nr:MULTISPECIES: glycosyltransferase [unclassified Synechococcus]MBC1262454.1 glycosyltransferase [Synechococcus sp. BSF8S]MBC1265337.1 glycosyltransferase [Synechococcus sp. BSA11S]